MARVCFYLCVTASVLVICSHLNAQQGSRYPAPKFTQQLQQNKRIANSDFNGIRSERIAWRSGDDNVAGHSKKATSEAQYIYPQAESVIESHHHPQYQPQRLETNFYNDSGMNYQPDERGFYPFVTGDIFGVSRQECCDEWNGHCECLELTSRHQKCQCSGYNGNSGGCTGCSPRVWNTSPTALEPQYRESKRRSVSEYFHPTR